MKIKNLLSFFLVMVLLGLTSVVLYQANNPSEPQPSENQQLIDIITQQESDIEEMELKIEELRADIDAELDQQTQGLSVISSLRGSLQGARYFSGLSERSGSGIVLTLTDNVQGAELAKVENPDTYRPENYIIHDKNLLYIVNDIKAAGPDGIDINGQRIVSNTNIRCVGTVILVNDRRLAPPYRISVLGDAETITQALFDSNEVEYLVNAGFSVTYEAMEELTLPAYKGNLNLQYAKLYVEPEPEPEPELETPEEEPLPEEPASDSSEPSEDQGSQSEPAADSTDEPGGSENDPDAPVDENAAVDENTEAPDTNEPGPPVEPQDTPSEETNAGEPVSQTDQDIITEPADEEVADDELQ